MSSYLSFECIPFGAVLKIANVNVFQNCIIYIIFSTFLSIMKYNCCFTPQNYIDKLEFAFIRYLKSFMSARSDWGAFVIQDGSGKTKIDTLFLQRGGSVGF